MRDFPGGAVVENLPANAGDTGSIPGPGRCSGATKPVRHNCWAGALRARAPQQEKPPQWEARAPQRRVAPLAATRENPHAATNAAKKF